MAFSHHDAAKRDQWRGCKANLFRAKEHGNGRIASGFDLAVGLQYHARTQIVHYQGLVGFGNT